MFWFRDFSNAKKYIVLFALFAFMFTGTVNFSAYCKPKKTDSKKDSKIEKSAEDENQNKNETGDKTNSSENGILLPGVKKKGYFSKIDSSIISDVEVGSPKSIESAVSKMRKNESDYDESEKVLLFVATQIMKIVWPSQRITWEVFPVTDENSYTEVFNSINNGFFDTSTGNVDFLTTILPALVILSPNVTKSDYDLCENALNIVLTQKDDSVLALYLMGVVKEKKGEIKKAEGYYKKAYELISDTLEIQLAYSRVLRLNGDYTSASKILSATQVENTNDVDVLKQNAYLAFEQKDFDKAEQYVARVLQQNPNDLDFVLFRAKILIEKNDYIHAVSLLDVYARQDDSSIDYLLLRAKVQLDWSKNTAGALETVEKGLQLYPDSLDALLIAASIAATTDAPVAGKYADELAEKVLMMEPNNVTALKCQLDGLVLHQNWSKAYDTCKKLISLAPNDTDILIDYVNVCVKLNKKDEANNYMTKMYRANPNDETVLQAYVLAYSNVGSRDEVIRFIDSMIPSANSKVKSNLYYRRSFLQKIEDNALADLRSSLIANPRNSESLFRLYEIYFGKEDYRKAQYYLRQVVAINPNDSSVKKLNEALSKLIN